MTGAPERRLSLRTDNVAARSFDEETLALDFRNAVYLSLNSAATVLWHELERGTTRAGLIDVLLDEFDVTQERAAADVDAFLAECRRRDLIVDEGDVGAGVPDSESPAS